MTELRYCFTRDTPKDGTALPDEVDALIEGQFGLKHAVLAREYILDSCNIAVSYRRRLGLAGEGGHTTSMTTRVLGNARESTVHPWKAPKECQVGVCDSSRSLALHNTIALGASMQ